MAMNLYDEDALRRFLQRQRLKQFDLMLVDPPRKDFRRSMTGSIN
ncbi:MAG: tRNA/tmRNA/rRNA uracil-C5-methylase (TrmA/RlmC/RlmD family) [Alcanivorax sp.]|jgi:tRNA/tmRNA/rRNA uracil-C5-methylase (TrmA/RlmC/RlmD family)